jgi:rhodanese-related sulfurtransferase
MKRTIIIVIIIAIAAVAVVFIYRNMNSNFTTMNANDFEKAITDNATIVLDVRSADEYAGGHIPNAINIDVNRAGFLYEVDEKLSKDKTIAVYCQGGVRSRKAATLLSDDGYTVINLAGGISEWKSAGKETEQ